jgi:hypothetical protein
MVWRHGKVLQITEIGYQDVDARHAANHDGTAPRERGRPSQAAEQGVRQADAEDFRITDEQRVHAGNGV